MTKDDYSGAFDGFTAEEIDAERITALAAMRGGKHAKLWDRFGSPDPSSAMYAGWAVAYVGFGRRRLIGSPAVVKEPNAALALAIRGLAAHVEDFLAPHSQVPILVRMRACGFTQRLSQGGRIAATLWHDVARLHSGASWQLTEAIGPVDIEELEAGDPRLRGHDVIVDHARKARDRGRRADFANHRPGGRTTFDMLDLPRGALLEKPAA